MLDVQPKFRLQPYRGPVRRIFGRAQDVQRAATESVVIGRRCSAAVLASSGPCHAPDSLKGDHTAAGTAPAVAALPPSPLRVSYRGAAKRRPNGVATAPRWYLEWPLVPPPPSPSRKLNAAAMETASSESIVCHDCPLPSPRPLPGHDYRSLYVSSHASSSSPCRYSAPG